MKPADKIKELISKSDVQTSYETDKRILGGALEHLDKLKLKKSPLNRPNIWRIIVKSPLTKFAAATVVLCVFGLYFLLGSDNILYAQQILDTIEKKSLMHTDSQSQIDDKNTRTERWYYYDSKIILSKYYNEGECYKISSLNYNTMENVVYEPNSNRVEILYRRDVSADFWTDSPLTILKEYIDDNKRDKGSMQLKKSKYEGKDVDIFNFSIPKDFRGDRVHRQFIVDHDTHLPIIYKRRAWTSEGNLHIDTTSTYDFPEEGPKDIYDLGVPKDTEVVYNKESKELFELKKELLAEKDVLEKQFQKSDIYYLEEDQILKNIPASLISERVKIYQINEKIRNLESDNLPIKESEIVDYMMYYWDESITDDSRPVFRGGVSLKGAFERIIGMSKFEYIIPEEFSNITISGDWIVRKGSSKEQKLRAFEKILQQYTGRNISFVNRQTERDVMVATGKYRFTPLKGTYDESWIHVFSDKLDPDESGGGGNGRALAQFLRRLGDVPLNIQVIDETESSDEMVPAHGCHMSSYIYKIEDEQEKARKLEILLDNLSLQTNLEFKLEHRKADTWFVEENEPEK